MPNDTERNTSKSITWGGIRRERIEKAADIAGTTPAEYIILAADEKAMRDLRKAGK